MSADLLQAIFDSINNKLIYCGCQTKELDDGRLEVIVPGLGIVKVTIEE